MYRLECLYIAIGMHDRDACMTDYFVTNDITSWSEHAESLPDSSCIHDIHGVVE